MNNSGEREDVSLEGNESNDVFVLCFFLRQQSLMYMYVKQHDRSQRWQVINFPQAFTAYNGKS